MVQIELSEDGEGAIKQQEYRQKLAVVLERQGKLEESAQLLEDLLQEMGLSDSSRLNFLCRLADLQVQNNLLVTLYIWV